MKKILLPLIACMLVPLCSGCDTAIHNAAYTDDAAIAKSVDSKVAILSIGNRVDNEYILTATMTGTQTVWRYNAKEDCEITVCTLLSVSEGGKAKLVLITPDDEVITLLENTDNTVTETVEEITLTLKPGSNRLKIVGYDSPRFEFRLTVDAGDLGSSD